MDVERHGIRFANRRYRKQVLGFVWRSITERKRLGELNHSRMQGSRPMRRDALRQDLRLAIRTLQRRPLYTVVAVLTLALGIGANTAVFSAVSGVLLRPLPFPEPEQLVRFHGYNTREGLNFGTISLPNLLDLRDRSRSFQAVAAYDEYSPLVTGGGGDPERVDGASVSASFFDILGLRPAHGRFFRTEEDEPGSARSVVLAHGFWARRYGADPGVIGTTIELSGIAYEIVGVAPAHHEDPKLSGGSFQEPSLWRSPPTYFQTAHRGSNSYTGIGRLRPGVTAAAAQAELTQIMAGLEAEFPDENTNRGVLIQGLQETIVADARTPLLVLLAAGGLVLLIACANVANLALVRALDGQRDMVVRAALGATRRRLAVQLLVENALVAGLGGLAGVALAAAGVRVLQTLAGEHLSRAANIAIDVRVLGFAAVAVIAAGMLFGLAPMLAVRRTDIAGTLREGGRGATSGHARRRLQQFLVATEVALSCALLVGAGLLIRSLAALQRVDTGVRAEGTLVVPYVPPLFAFDSVPQLTALYRSIEERVGAIPGVQHAGIIDILPMSGSFNGNTFTIAGRPEPAAGERWSAETRAASANALEALGIEIGRGRSITTADRQDAARVAIINETLARRWWPDADPIGAQINVLGELREIVGIAADVREFTPDRAPDPGIWVPHEQAPDWIRTQRTHVIVHTTGDPFERAAAVRQTLRDIEPRAAIGTPNAMRNVVAATVAAPRFRTTLLIAFAGVALLLAIVGIYGVVSRAVAQRRHEMGIRLSLGASGADVLGILVRDGMLPVLGGIVAGVLGAFALARVLEGLLFGVAAADPLTFVVAPLALALTALLACLLPARRATHVDPAHVLRSD
jgi:putative ABC transport system permease protein